ncbi:MAG: Ppx/GppA family phosphatase, partial [Pseudomonadota bacterium]
RLDKKAIELIYEASQSKDAILRQRLARASQKRAAVLPYAAMVLNQVVQLGGFDEIIVSASGLREGVIRHGLPNTAGKRDPLFDGIDLYLRLPDQARRFGHSLFGWLGGALRQGPDLFGDVDVSDRILEAACRLADSGARFHPDHRASMVFDQVLRGPFTGVTHTERLFLALAVGHRYARGLRCPERLQPLLAPGLVDFAAQLGACMRVGCVYSGRSADVLKTSRLERSRDALVLSVETPRTAMVSNEVERRLATAADLLGSRPEVRTH